MTPPVKIFSGMPSTGCPGWVTYLRFWDIIFVYCLGCGGVRVARTRWLMPIGRVTAAGWYRRS
jgi:hypothetical protein